MATKARTTTLVDTMKVLLGTERVITDTAERTFYSQDIFNQGECCMAVVRPQTVDHLADVIGAISAAEADVLVRGGGMSYTGGYLPQRTEAVIIDMADMNRIVEINETDMYVIVEAGCTWADLRAKLQPLGLKTPYWGPLSGLRSTIGGAMSQNSVFFGSARHGTAADSVIGLTVVLADGTVVDTGSGGGTGANGFFRHYGPDLTGLFTGDAGAFAVKARVTLRLMRSYDAKRFAAFDFDTRDSLFAAMTAIAREGLATEIFGFDPALQAIRMKRASLSSDLKTLSAVVTGQESIGRGLKEGIKMAVAGRRFVREDAWPLYVALEERDTATADAALAQTRKLARDNGGIDTENTVPKAVHAAPFGPMNGIIGVEGQRWVPVHGVLPNSRTRAFLAALDTLLADAAASMQRLGITTGCLLTSVGPGATLVEPVFYWPDARLEIHERSIEPGFLAKLPLHPEGPEARAMVDQLREGIISLFGAHGAVHFQVGKTYPWFSSRTSGAQDLADRLKRTLDPNGSMNPSALGLV